MRELWLNNFMNDRGIRIGKFFGIELRLDYSWFVLFFLVAWWLTVVIVPGIYGQLSALETIATGLVTTLLFFLSVIVHEYAHAVYAKRSGLNIKTITLFIFGGATQLLEESKSPRQEFVMAALGPVTSLLIAAAFIAVASAGIALGIESVTAIGGIVASVNIILAVFNLFPGFPLDGGRMFRAVIWKITNDIVKATKIAALGGRLFAYFIIAFGLIQIIFAGNIGGLWLVLIGFFLRAAAVAGYEQTLAGMLLKNIKVSDMMKKPEAVVPGNTTVKDFIESFVLGRKSDRFPVELSRDNGVGIVGVEDIKGAPLKRRIEEYAKIEGSIRPDDSAMKALSLMSALNFSELPVVKNGKVVGILSAEIIRSYIMGKQELRPAR